MLNMIKVNLKKVIAISIVGVASNMFSRKTIEATYEVSREMVEESSKRYGMDREQCLQVRFYYMSRHSRSVDRWIVIKVAQLSALLGVIDDVGP